MEDLTWVAVYASDRGQAHVCREALEHRGIRAVVRSDFDRRHGFTHGRGRVEYEVVGVLVPETEAELALTLVEGPIADEVEELTGQTSFGPQPDDDYFQLRNRMDIEMPHAGRRAKDRAARRALAELDGRPASERPDQPPSEGCRRQMLIAMVIVLTATVVLVILWLASGRG